MQKDVYSSRDACISCQQTIQESIKRDLCVILVRVILINHMYGSDEDIGVAVGVSRHLCFSGFYLNAYFFLSFAVSLFTLSISYQRQYWLHTTLVTHIHGIRYWKRWHCTQIRLQDVHQGKSVPWESKIV